MQNNSFSRLFLLVCIIALLASCDKDFNEIGSDIIGDDHFILNLDVNQNVTARNQNLGVVQSNNLPINPLGIYNNPVFGLTKANFVSQLELGTLNPTFNPALHPEIESVILTVPYFSTKTATDAEGAGTYKLDSINGTLESKIKLSVFESGYYLRDLDAVGGFEERQKYFTNQNADFNNVKGTLLNNDADLTQNNEFVFSPKEFVETKVTDGKTVITRTAPAMRLTLDKTFFKTKIIEAPSGKLANNNVFKDYFRGIYFQVDYSGSDPGNLALLNFAQGKITIKYKEDASNTTGGVTTITREEKTLLLNLSGISVSLLENSSAPAINPERLYLKGGEGSMAVIDLFGPDYDNNGVSDQLEALRANNWLINEANLTFYVDKTAMSGAPEPNRVYLYDLNNNRPLIDYFIDNTVSAKPKLSKAVFVGILEKETTGTDKRGIKYKIRLTNYIRNLIKHSDSTNVKLGLVVTENIAAFASVKLKTPILSPVRIDRMPFTSVINPLGTILYGSNIPVTDPNFDKRLKLEIYYTKPN